MEPYYPCTWLSFVNQKNEKIRNWSLLMKIISTVPKLLFFKTTDLHTICIPILLICWQLKHHQLRIRSEVFNVWKYHFQIFILGIAPLLSISVSILSEFAMLPDVYILLSHQQEEVDSSSWGNKRTNLAANSSKILKPLSAIILVGPCNT